jgi:acyl carrier protein
MDRRNEVKSFIITNFLFGDGGNLADTDSFLNKGIVDSTGILEVISFLEEKYGITVKDDELLPANLDSIDNIVNFLNVKLQ